MKTPFLKTFFSLVLLLNCHQLFAGEVEQMNKICFIDVLIIKFDRSVLISSWPI